MFRHVLILDLICIPYTDHCIVYTQSEINANKKFSEFLHSIKECHDLNHFLILFPFFSLSFFTLGIKALSPPSPPFLRQLPHALIAPLLHPLVKHLSWSNSWFECWGRWNIQNVVAICKMEPLVDGGNKRAHTNTQGIQELAWFINKLMSMGNNKKKVSL